MFLRFAITIIIGAGLATSGLLGFAWWYEQEHVSQHEVLFIVPKGTVIRQANGDGMMVPQRITLTIGKRDTLIIRNDDVWPAQIGPFRLQPGQRIIQRFRTPGMVEFECSTMYHTEQLTVMVQPGALEPWALARALVRQ